MEFQEAWPEAMTIGPLSQCQSTLFDGVGELDWNGEGGAVGSISSALMVVGEGVIKMVSVRNPGRSTVEVSARDGTGGGEKLSMEMAISNGIQCAETWLSDCVARADGAIRLPRWVIWLSDCVAMADGAIRLTKQVAIV